MTTIKFTEWWLVNETGRYVHVELDEKYLDIFSLMYDAISAFDETRFVCLQSSRAQHQLLDLFVLEPCPFVCPQVLGNTIPGNWLKGITHGDPFLSLSGSSQWYLEKTSIIFTMNLYPLLFREKALVSARSAANVLSTLNDYASCLEKKTCIQRVYIRLLLVDMTNQPFPQP